MPLLFLLFAEVAEFKSRHSCLLLSRAVCGLGSFPSAKSGNDETSNLWDVRLDEKHKSAKKNKRDCSQSEITIMSLKIMEMAKKDQLKKWKW